jgi:hypothetical protein
MKLNELDHHKLAQILLVTPLSSLHQKHSTIKETILEMNATENSLEVEFINDLFCLSTDEVADKWYEGNDDIIVFFFKEE